MSAGLVIAAPASGSGKTTVTLALLRLLAREGQIVAPFKTGPDYIDGAFHRAASAGRPCCNLDAFAMRPATLNAVLAWGTGQAELVVVEGVMGLFDAAANGEGSTADLAARLRLPILLVVDAARQSQSVAALVHGFRSFRTDVTIGGVILNRVASPRHEALLRRALAPLGLPVIAVLPPRDDLTLPDRHLGLMQAEERSGLDLFLDKAADWLHHGLDRDAFEALPAPLPAQQENDAPAALPPPALPPLGQRIAVAQDIAFAFAYPHLLAGWRAQGAELLPFSPLHDEAPDAAADAVFLPGGYPELHAGRLAGNARLLAGLHDAASRGAVLYGECGGFMLLGEGLVDADGCRHAMAGLLPVATSFAQPRRHLGYRRIVALTDLPFGPAGRRFRGHEFHYSSQIAGLDAPPLFRAADAEGADLGPAGARIGPVCGSYLHLIDQAAP
jgi:cobyrinic acid a,c-diamide synthase